MTASSIVRPSIAVADPDAPTHVLRPASDGSLPVSGTFSLAGFTPNGNVANLSVTTSSANVALPTGTVVAVANTGSTDAHINLSVGAGTAATTDFTLKAGATVGLTVGSNTYINAITISSTTALSLAGGTGLVSGYGGSSSGSSSNASVSATGAAVPASATFLGSQDGSGNLQGASAANPLPTADATVGSNTSTINTTLSGVQSTHSATLGNNVFVIDPSTGNPITYGTTDTNLKQVNGATTDSNNGNVSAGTQRVTLAADSSGQVAAIGKTASGASLTENPLAGGGLAKTSLPTAVSDGQKVNSLHDKYGRQVAPCTLRENRKTQFTTITSSTSETTIVTADASNKLDLYMLVISNTSATACNVTIKDSTAGTTRGLFAVPAGDSRGFTVSADSGIPQAATNSNWTATCSASVASINITAGYVVAGS